MKDTFNVYNDPGHGWIAVKRKLLRELGILEKITSFSYQKGQTVYLEEDLDAATFVLAYIDRFGTKPNFIDKHTERQSPCRSYECFRP